MFFEQAMDLLDYEVLYPERQVVMEGSRSLVRAREAENLRVVHSNHGRKVGKGAGGQHARYCSHV